MTIRFEKDGSMNITHRAGYPTIQWDHVDGPLLTRSDGSIHWLTFWERLKFFFGKITVEDLDPTWAGEGSMLAAAEAPNGEGK